MRLFKLLAIHAAIAATLCCSFASGQTTVPSSRFRPLPAEMPEATSPFTEFGVYDYDQQMFAPYDLRELEEPCGPIGFYVAYDRVYLSVSKPGVQEFNNPIDDPLVPVGNHYIWGNRFDLGVMNENETGWGLDYTRAAGMFFSSGQDILVPTPFLTETAVHNLKLNRIFRQDLQNGGWLEPYFGFRFIAVFDDTIEDSIIGGNPNRFKQTAGNSAYGAHVGARHVRKYGRWGLATDGSLATTYNAQSYFATDITTVGTNLVISEFYDEDASFVPALDLRADLSYAMTRDLALRLGVQALYLWSGVNRANTLPSIFNPNSINNPAGLGGPNGVNDEDFVSAGFTFGIEWKR